MISGELAKRATSSAFCRDDKSPQFANAQRLRNEELRVDAHSSCEAARADSSSKKAVTLQIQSVDA
jgi:hypothetical protein